MPKERKYRKCPSCKSDKGFQITTYLGGYQTDHMDFKGKVIDSDRCGVDKTESYACCVNCGHSILAENLQLGI